MSNTINEIKEEDSIQAYPQDIEAYRKVRIIGRGSFGSLYEALIISGNHKDENVAIKEVKLDMLNEKSLETFKVRKNFNFK
jgi:serine/threonine protein kinase